MIIDGNRVGWAILFDHEKHIRQNGGNDSCAQCHHMLKPMDEATSCAECHRDMFLKTSIFDHSLHQKRQGGNRGCEKCHKRDEPKSPETAKACSECHTTMEVKGSRITIQTQGPERWKWAVGYKDAMHGLCVNCHKEKAEGYEARRSAGKPRISAEGNPISEAEWIAKERLHFCPTCHRELEYTQDPIPAIRIPAKRSSVPFFLERREPPGSAKGLAGETLSSKGKKP